MDNKMLVNLLKKEQLTYELALRGVAGVESLSVDDLRKKLRDILKIGVKENPLNLIEVINAERELAYIGLENDWYNENIEQFVEARKNVDLVRHDQRLKHLIGRVNNFEKFVKTGEATKKSLAQYLKSFKEWDEKLFDAITVEEKQSIIQNVSVVFDSEEEQAPVNLNNSLMSNASALPDVSLRPENVLSFAKMANPTDKHTKNLKVTNGSNVYDILSIIKCMLDLSSECRISIDNIYTIILNYCSGILYEKVLNCKERNASLPECHDILLRFFVPFGLKHDLIKKFVIRPQNYKECLGSYVNSVKEYNKLLKTGFQESEVVDLIKRGINPDTRSKLVFCDNPKSYCDLDNLIIQAQEISYEDNTRSQMFAKPRNVCNNMCYDKNVTKTNTDKRNAMPVGNKLPVGFDPTIRPPKVIKCFICSEVGHIAKFCKNKLSKN